MGKARTKWLDVQDPLEPFIEHVKRNGYRFRALPNRRYREEVRLIRVYDYRFGTYHSLVGLSMCAHGYTDQELAGARPSAVV